MVKHHTLVGSESEKRDEIMDRVDWLKETFDWYPRINPSMNNPVGHLCREPGRGGGGVSRNNKQRIWAIRWSQQVTFIIMTCLTDDFNLYFWISWLELLHIYVGDRRSRDRMVVGFTTTSALSTYHDRCCEIESRSERGVQHYVIKIVSDLRQVDGFHRVLRFPPPIKLTAMI